MARWMLKAALQAAMFALPGGERINYFLQEHVTHSLVLDDVEFGRRMHLFGRQLDGSLRHASFSPLDFVAFEIGTGWFPTIPIGLFLCGADRVVTIDKFDHLRVSKVVHVLDMFLRHAENGKLHSWLPRLQVSRLEKLRQCRRGTQLRTAKEILAEMSITAVTGDARHLTLPDSSIDLIVSYGTLEYIPEGILQEMFREFQRVAKEGSVMTHYVNLSDEFAAFDPSIARLNFLKYPDAVWRLTRSPLNRLRVSDYRRIHEEAGFSIVQEESRSEPSSVLKAIRPATRFRSYPLEELLISEVWLTSKTAKPGSAA